MKKEQYRKIADQMILHIEAILGILTNYEIDSARLHATGSDGYFSIELSQEGNEIEILRLDSDSKIKLKTSEEL